MFIQMLMFFSLIFSTLSTSLATPLVHLGVIRVGLAEVVAVGVQVVASVGCHRGVSWAFAAAFGALFSNFSLVAFLLGQFGAVRPLVNARRLGGDRCICWSIHLGALGNNHHLANSTHANTPLQPDEPRLAPRVAPRVLNLPKVNA